LLNVLLGISSYLAIFLLRKFTQPLETLAEKSTSLLDALMSKQEEEKKVQAIQDGMIGVLKSLFVSLIILLGVTLFALSPFLLGQVFKTSILSGPLFSIGGILGLSVGSTLGFIFPKIKFEGDFSPVIKLLHRLSLNNYNLHLRLHKREVKRSKANQKTPRKDFIIITGLARAGTTSLLNKLALQRNLKSLHYGNMPFLLAPNTWKRVYNPKAGELKERSHKDGIMVNNLSYEALEEYFFKAVSEDGFITSNSLLEYDISTEIHEAYLDYQLLFRTEVEDRYLAKNNNFLIRYESMRGLNPDFKVVLMFRNPLSHASSLLEKHNQYSKSHEVDPFELEYMNWLGHHEFGLGQKVFEFTNNGTSIEVENKFSLDYWLQVWINYYTKVLSVSKHNMLLMPYETYCSNPKNSHLKISRFLGLDQSFSDQEAYTPKRKPAENYSTELSAAALEIYDRLIEISKR